MTSRKRSTFIDAINAQDFERPAELMTDDYTFVGLRASIRPVTAFPWVEPWCAMIKLPDGGYFEWFSDYQIEVHDIFEGQTAFAMFGFAVGDSKKYRSKMAPTRRLESLGGDDQIARWQVVADTKVPFESTSGAQNIFPALRAIRFVERNLIITFALTARWYSPINQGVVISRKACSAGDLASRHPRQI